MSIVCGIDFSEPSREAARVAATIARKRGEALILVHSTFSDSEHAKLHASLDAEAAALRNTELIVSAELCFGWPDDDLERIAEEANASMIVVGAIGHRRGTHWVAGSIPERLARVTRQPLLVVRNGAPLEGWVRDAASLTCVAGTDLTASSRRVIDAANRMAALGRTKVVLTYVVDHPAEYARLDLGGPIYHRRMHPVVEEVVTRDLQSEARAITCAASVETQCPMTLGRTADPLFFAADENGAELIVTGAHQRHGPPRLWHGSVAHDVLHGASTNVLIVPLHGEDESAAALRVPNVTAVLAATDFSPGGDRALAWAHAVTPAGARLRLTHVIREENERSGATEQLRRRAEALGIDAESCEVVRSKDVAAAIGAAGERFGAQLVCVGASGDGGTAHPFFGSVARGLLTRSRVPVLAVRET
jgi:nucleotide-binding universal stress UspA family protein